MLERVRGVTGVAQLVEAPRYPGSIVLAEVGGTSLAELAKPLPVDDLIGLALELARAVAGMHRRGVLHCDITPANIVIAPDGAPCLVDFALATSVAEIRPEFAHRGEIIGTLAYLAPEQTGRTGRPVDQRADLYALGATFYELATGAPPFDSGDPLRLIHDHLARMPTPPAEVNPALPAQLAEVVLHLLEKEPDNRYQTADGLAHDLEQLRNAQTAPAPGRVRIGEQDFPLRLRPPSRLVGRDAEVAVLQAAFDDALAGRCQAVLVGGAPGVGKSALVDQLRPVVAGRGGWFVAGKFDQYRRDLAFDAGYQAFCALGRLLLAEPEDELIEIRERILAALGPNAGLLSAIVPEFAALLAVPPNPGNPLTAQVRTQRVALEVLRAVASRERPLVMFFDDLQWAAPTPLGLLDMLLDEEPVEGLLLVSAHREPDVDGGDPLTARLSRWLDQAGVRHVRLYDLPLPSLVTMVADMLHVPPATAAGLARQLHQHTSGNPYETVELLGGLRRDGLLTATAAGWQWDTATVRARLSRTEVGELLVARVAATPAGTRRLLEAMAGLGGRVDVSVLGAATGQPADVLERTLAPALVEGVLVAEPGLHDAVRFRHDRMRETIIRGIDPARQQTLHLAMARRLAAEPDLFAVAAEQYLPLTGTPDALADPAERRRIVELLRRAADQARLVADHLLMDALLAGALKLVDPDDTTILVELRLRRLAALYSLGRLEEADGEYRAIEDLRPGVALRANATAVQMHSLTHRGRVTDAVIMGVALLRELGIAVPAELTPAEIERQHQYLYRWLDESDLADDLARPDITDPTLLGAAALIAAVLPAAYFLPDLPLYTWLSLEAVRILSEHGPAQSLIGSTGVAAVAVTVQHGENYAVAYRAMRRVLALGEARAYEPETSLVRSAYASVVVCWFEPVENSVPVAQQARMGLIAGGDLAWAGYAYHPELVGLLEYAPSLDGYADEVETARAFLHRTGNEQTAQWFDGNRWVAAVLRGEGPEGTAEVAAPIPADRYPGNPAALLYAHIAHALVAAILGDAPGLVHHAAAAMPLLPVASGLYPTAVARLLRGLALAEEARGADGAERAALLAELGEMSAWLAARSADAPENFLHLLRLLDAERAWIVGDFRAAAQAFDAARREVAHRQRPWHRALITERAARFHLAHGLEQAGRDLLARARHDYAAWGATAKVAQLDWAYPTLRSGARATVTRHGGDPGGDPRANDRRASPTVTTGTLDLLGILAASHALGSETSIERLHAGVVEVLSAMTGATGVHLLLWNDDRREWLLPTPGCDTDSSAPGGPSHEHDLPMSAVHYVQRTAQTLVVDDATRDDRFARDPYLAGLDGFSLLAMPIRSRGTPRAVLLLENRLFRAAFTAERLDAVRLIAAQLAVSLDNAQLYADLTASRARIVAASDQARRRIERDLHDGAQQRLVTLAMHARMARAAVPPESSILKQRLDAIAADATTAMAELRELARGIHPPTLTQSGLLPALRALARRSRVPVRIAALADRRLPEAIEIATYYVVAEALTNATKHADASAVTIWVEIDTIPAGVVLQVQVQDDGRGGGAHFSGGSGLLGLKDRVETLGGRLVVHSAPGTGTTVEAEFPLPHAESIPG